MDQQKIDRLFREKLRSNEVAPSNEAWESLSGKIQNRNTSKTYYWVAASLFPLLIGFIAFVYWSQDDSESFNSIADHPVKISRELENIYLAKIDLEQIIQKEKEVKRIPVLIARVVEDRSAENLKENLNIIDEDKNGSFKIASAEINISEESNIKSEDEISENEFIATPIKITYISSKTEKKETILEIDSVSTFDRVIAFTDNLSPENVLIGIRSAKDNLLSGSFKNKKTRNSL